MLGASVPAATLDLIAGDWVEVSQLANVTTDDVVRVSGSIQAHGQAAGVWRVELRIGERVAAARTLREPRRIPLDDLVADVSRLDGEVLVALRLVFVGGES